VTQGDDQKKRPVAARAVHKPVVASTKAKAGGASTKKATSDAPEKPRARRSGAPAAVAAESAKRRPSARPRATSVPPPQAEAQIVEPIVTPKVPSEPEAPAPRSPSTRPTGGALHLDGHTVAGVPGGRMTLPPGRVTLAPYDEDDEGSVLITGICGRLGKLLTRELHRVSSVVGIDRRPFPDAPRDVVHHRIDVRRKKTKDVFRQHRVRAVVHLGVLHDPRTSQRMRHSWNVVAFQKLLEYMTQYRVPKLVVLSSANVYGPQPDNPQFLTEEAPLLGSQEFGAIRDLVELDMLAQSFFWRHPETETVILRPCHILGSVRNAPSNYLRLERPITVMGFDPMVQVVHERDVVAAVRLAIEPGVKGIFNLRGPGELPLSRLLAKLGRTPRSVPGPLAEAIVDQMWRLRLSTFPSPEIDHIRYICMVDDTRARNVLGYTPGYSLDQTLEAVLD
jgi:UDP-glucose 4-epimerase